MITFKKKENTLAILSGLAYAGSGNMKSKLNFAKVDSLAMEKQKNNSEFINGYKLISYYKKKK
jgi:hypothetical protein